MYDQVDQIEERKPKSCLFSCTAASDPQEDTTGPCFLSDCASFLPCCYSAIRLTVWLSRAKMFVQPLGYKSCVLKHPQGFTLGPLEEIKPILSLPLD